MADENTLEVRVVPVGVKETVDSLKQLEGAAKTLGQQADDLARKNIAPKADVRAPTNELKGLGDAVKTVGDAVDTFNRKEIAPNVKGVSTAITDLDKLAETLVQAGLKKEEFDKILGKEIGSEAVKQLNAAFGELNRTIAQTAQIDFNKALGVKELGEAEGAAKRSAAAFEEHFKKQEDGAKRSEAALKTQADAQAKMAAEARKLRAEIDPLGAAQDRINERIQSATRLYQAGMITKREFAQATRMLRNEMEGLTRADSTSWLTSYGRGVGDADQRTARFGSSLRNLTSTMNLVRAGAVGLASGGIAALASEMAKASDEAQKLESRLQALSNSKVRGSDLS
jgi:uncharacterized protein YoxC/uncharacterized protein YqgQ